MVPAPRIGALEGVQRLPHAPVPQPVEVHLEAVPVELTHVAAQPLRVDEREARVARAVAAPVEVGLDQGRGPVLGDPVLHDLDRRGREPPACVRLPLGDQLRDLLAAAPPLPPQGADHRCGEVAACRGPGVRRTGVAHPRVGPDDGVLPARDAQRVEVALALEESGVELVVVGDGQDVGEQFHRALVEHAGRLPIGVALDPTVGGVGGGGGDAGRLQGARVDPETVVVAVGEGGGSVGHDLVQLAGGRQTAGEGRHRPAPTLDPVQVAMRGGVVADVSEVGAPVDGEPAQVAAEPLQPALDRMDVGVGEAGQQQPARHVDDACADRRRPVADAHDAPVVDDDITEAPAVVEAVEDGRVLEDRPAHRPILHPRGTGRLLHWQMPSPSNERPTRARTRPAQLR